MIQQDVGFLVNRFLCLSPPRKVASVLLSWLTPDFYLESPMALVSKPWTRPAVTRATPTTVICSANEPADWQLCEWNGLSPSRWKQCGISPSSDWRWEDDKENNQCLAYTRNLTWFQSNANSLYHLVTLICDSCCSNTLHTFWYSPYLPSLHLISALQIPTITSEPLIPDLIIFVEHGPSSFIAVVLKKLIQ